MFSCLCVMGVGGGSMFLLVRVGGGMLSGWIHWSVGIFFGCFVFHSFEGTHSV